MSMHELRILVADDEPAVRQQMERIIRGHGHHYEGVEDGRMCLQKLQQGVYDVLFIDLFMPTLDGLHVLSFARNHSPSTRLIVISSLDDEPTIEQVLKNGASAFLLKPLQDAAITEVINRVASGTISQDLTPKPNSNPTP